MLYHHLLLALRNLRRRAFFSAINIVGLAVGLAACWLIGLYVWHENSYDQFLPQADRICAVSLDLKMGEEEAKTTNTPPPVGPRLAADFPEIECAARTFNLGSVVVRREQPGIKPLVFNENTAMAADTSFLELFEFPMLMGDIRSALDKPGSMVISEKMAQKYFGSQEVMGQSLLLNDRLFNITGIAKNLPSNASVQFDFLLPMADFKVVDRFSWSWVWLQVDTWIRLRQSPTKESLMALEAKFPDMVRRYAPAAFERIGQNFEENMRRGDRWDLKLLPLKTLHLESAGLSSRLTTLGDGQQVRMFGIVGALILLLACVNFMNLSTARSMQRAREVGVRKALGSSRTTLMAQFLSEAFLYSMAAMLLAAALALTALPFFNHLTGYEWDGSALFSTPILGLVLALPLLTTVLGGLYPAFYLSHFKAGDLSGMAGRSAKGGHPGLRSGLVVFQFAASIALMICSFVVFKQMEFAQKQTPGLKREHVLIVENAQHLDTPTKRDAFQQQLRQLPEVLHSTHSTYLPSLGSFGDFYEPEQGNQSGAVVQNLSISSYLTDADFVPTLGIELIDGRNFESNSNLNSNAVILNEAAVKAIGWEKGVGKWMRYPGNENQRFQVVGVMRDFHITSVKTAIEPVAIFHQSSNTYRTWGSYLALRLQPGTEKAAIAKVEALWKATVPSAPFEYNFLDASFANLYRSEAKTASVLGVFTGLALLVGCLGLFALAAFTAEQRTKEIGIRKTLGASVASVAGLLTKDFFRLVLLSLVLACPIAYYYMQKWLSDFVYRIDMEWWMFVFTGLAALFIAVLTVGFQSIKAALANPVDALRSE